MIVRLQCILTGTVLGTIRVGTIYLPATTTAAIVALIDICEQK